MINNVACLPVQYNFVKTIRAIELILGIPVPGLQPLDLQLSTGNSSPTPMNMSSAIPLAAEYDKSGIFTAEIQSVLEAAVPILLEIGQELGISENLLVLGQQQQFGGMWTALVTK